MAVNRFENNSTAAGSEENTNGSAGREQDRRGRSAWMTAAVMLAVVGGVYLVQQHWTHLAGNWVYLALLACPLMHLFMHRGHGGHGGHGSHHARNADHDHRGPPG